MGRLDDLATAMPSGDIERIKRLVSGLTALREISLYQELGMLTRETHASMRAFAGVSREIGRPG